MSLAMLIAVLRLTVADGHAQTLGELAIREAARRATMSAPSRVYTNVPRARNDRDTMPATTTPAVVAPTPVATSTAEAIVRPVAPETPAALTPSLPLPASAIADRNGAAPAARGSSAPAASSAEAKATAFSSPPAAPPSSLAGWSPFTIKKTPAELAETARLADVSRPAARTNPHDVKLPRQRDVMRLSTGVGHLQGGDWGGDVSGSGKINGMQTDVNAFFTAGPMGVQSRSGRVSIYGPGGGWRGEGGDLYSDLRGLARGARVSWSAVPRWRPSVSVYLPREGAPGASTVLAYRDRLQLLPRVRVSGEATSDGAVFLQGQYAHPRLDLTAFYRVARAPITGHDKGVSGGVSLGRGVALAGAMRLSDAVGDSSSQWQLASIRLPLPRQASVTLERSWWSGATDDGSTNAITVQAALGPVRVIQRLQWGRTDYRQRAVPFSFNRRQSQSTASYTPGRWGSLNYQQSTQWFDDGRVQEWDEVSSMVQLGRHTTVQFVTAFPDISDPRRFRARVTQRLSPTLLLEAQYGRLSAFQMTRGVEGEQSRVMVTLRKTWMVESPARGGDVRGRAVDQAGYPVPGALVRLGPYSAITDEAGAYEFTRVPDGQFELALDKAKLPAAYAWDENPRPLTVTRASRERVDVQVIPLNAIRGRVYIDRNRNGHFDEDEGLPNVVVMVNGSVTATSATGAYAFYNQPPGRYTVRLDVSRLAKGLAPASAAEIDVELTGDHPVVGADFTIEERDMPILMRKIPG